MSTACGADDIPPQLHFFCDGTFWMYGTVQGENLANAPNSFHLAGPAFGWPRYRKNRLGSARTY